MSSKGEIEERKRKVKKWLSRPTNFLLILIILGCIITRVYFFIPTSDQTLWWDEAEYGSTAKKWALDVDYNLNPQRPPLFQYLWSLMIQVGAPEVFIKILLVMLPSIALVFSIFLLGKEMYNERIGLIAATLASVSWTLVFWSNRFQPDFLSMTLQVLSIYFMWEYLKNPSYKPIILSALFAALAFYFKISALLVPLIFAVFLLLKDRLSAFTKKEYYVFALVFFVTLIPYFIWSYMTFNTPFAFTTGYIQPVAESTPFGWYNLKFYYNLTTGLTFILFLIGTLYALKFLLYADKIAKKKELTMDPDIFSILAFLLISAFYIFHIKNTDDRWVFLWLPFIFFMVGHSLEIIMNYVKRFGKGISVALVMALLAVAIYGQLTHASLLIDLKKTSYAPVKESALWIKDKQNPQDVIITQSYTQATYYSERTILNHDYFKNESALNSFIESFPEKNSAKIYVIVSAFEYHFPWFTKWLEENQQRLTPVKVYVQSQNSQEPVLVVYEVNYQ